MTTPTDNLLDELHDYRTAIDQTLDDCTQPAEGVPDRLTAAVRYSVLAPGKRLRPLLAMLACEAVGGAAREALVAGCSVELIHVYSLIHDDLPAMDDDDLRRGQASCHRRFDEATAILAGDCLQMLAVEILCENYPAPVAAECCRLLAAAAGRSRLVGGQVDDLAAEGRFPDPPVPEQPALEQLKHIHRRKTGALIEASLCLGGVAGGGSLDHLKGLRCYGQALGLAFQIVDDCLDVESTAEQLGKSTRKDVARGKLTYPGLLGLQESRRLAADYAEQACSALKDFSTSADRLRRLADFVVQRSN